MTLKMKARPCLYIVIIEKYAEDMMFILYKVDLTSVKKITNCNSYNFSNKSH